MNNFSIAMCVSALTFVLTAGGAAAQVDQQTKDTCDIRNMADDIDAAIAACTAIIDADQAADAATRSFDYARRGLQYERVEQDDKAIADYRTALQLDPDNTVAQNGIDDLPR